MKNQNLITAPLGVNYLNQFMSELPYNCLFNKGLTGCGATELVLTNNTPTIIAMPYIALVENKTVNTDRRIPVLGVSGGVSIETIYEFARANKLLKIATTYDSLPKVIKALEMCGINAFKEMFLLVDEWHVLFNSYVFRNETVKSLLNIANRFQKVTYMTATPIEPRYVLNELKHLPTVEVEWPEKVRVNIISRLTNNPVNFVIGTIRHILSNSLGDNHHFFVNSVDMIAKIIKGAALKPEQVKVVCSKSNESYERNSAKLGAEYRIEHSHDPAKQFNFYTSACFEGCDIMDEGGRTYIVSDGSKTHTLVDISTQFIQICGRIRNSKYKTEITHIYSTTRYGKDVTLNDFIRATANTVRESKRLVADFNKMSKESQEVFSRSMYLNEKYIQAQNGTLTIDLNLAKLDIINFKVCSCIYGSYVNLHSEQQAAGYNLAISTYTQMTVGERVAANPKVKLSFEELFKEYCRHKAVGMVFLGGEFYADQIAQKNPIIKEAYDKLGVAKVEQLKYKVSNIRRELVNYMDGNTIDKVVRLSDDTFTKGVAIPVCEVKTKLQSIYDTLNIPRKAKSTDVNQWYETSTANRIVKGVCTACIVIVRKKWSRKK